MYPTANLIKILPLEAFPADLSLMKPICLYLSIHVSSLFCKIHLRTLAIHLAYLPLLCLKAKDNWFYISISKDI